MKMILSAVLGLGLVFAVTVGTPAADKEAKKLEGKITCAKCDLGKSAKCATVIVVKESGKDVIYWFDKAAHGKYHKPICKEGKEGTVTGTVKKEGDKMIVTVKELKFK